MPNLIFTILFFVIGFLISLFFYGLKAYEIHGIPEKDKNKLRRINQYWLNFLGSSIGWIFLYYFLIFRLHLFTPGESIMKFEGGLSDLIVILVVFLGITGHLPYAVLLKGIFKT